MTQDSLQVICHICRKAKDPAHDGESEGWGHDFYNHNDVCPACQERYEQNWPFPHWDEPEILVQSHGARFTSRAFRHLTGAADPATREKILIRFFRDHNIPPIYGENRVVIHPGREIWVYFH